MRLILEAKFGDDSSHSFSDSDIVIPTGEKLVKINSTALRNDSKTVTKTF